MTVTTLILAWAGATLLGLGALFATSPLWAGRRPAAERASIAARLEERWETASASRSPTASPTSACAAPRS